MRWLILAIALLLTACSDPRTERSVQSLSQAEHVTAVLEHFDLGLISPYIGTPIFFGDESGWMAISDPPEWLLTALSDAALTTASENWTRRCTDDEKANGCYDKCVPHEPPFCDERDYICVCPDVAPPEMPQDPGCSGPDYTGVWCGAGIDVAQYLDCCGWCGCDLVGCQYDCSALCPESEHPEYPYYAP